MKALQLKVTLRESKPLIWRRIIVKKNIKFAHLHNIIQEVFDWESYHLHSFTVKNLDKADFKNEVETERIRKLVYEDLRRIGSYINDTIQIGDPEQDEMGELFQKSEFDTFPIDYLKKPGDKVIYTYDFGDNWDHTILLEKIVDAPAVESIKCIKAVGFSPFEDFGGIWNWNEFVQKLKKSKTRPQRLKLWQKYFAGSESDFEEEFFDQILNPVFDTANLL